LLNKSKNTTTMPNKEARITRAIEEFGSEIVDFTLSVVYLADPDGAWSLFQERGMMDHAQCVENIYFE